MKDAVTAAATEHDLSEGDIVRKALRAYFASNPSAAPELENDPSLRIAEEPPAPSAHPKKQAPQKKIGFGPNARQGNGGAKFHRTYRLDSRGQMPPHDQIQPRDLAQD